MNANDRDRDAVFVTLAASICRIQPRIRPEQILPESSLTQDLAMDSLDLSSLFSSIKSEIVDLDLTPWFLSAARRGTDSLASLAEFVSVARDRAA